MDKVVWGMIGCGNVTEIKSAPAFYKLENSCLQAVMCVHIENAKAYAFKHHVPEYYDDADKIIHNPLIDAVYIATPVKFHAPYAITAMEAGKTVYVEKPMALKYKDCIELKEVSKRTGSKLFVAYYRRSLEYFIKVKELLIENSIGTIQDVTVSLIKPPLEADYKKEKLHWRVLPELAGAGYFYDLSCHQFDILQFLLGTIKSAKGIAENRGGLYPAEDTVHADWEFENGIDGTGNWSFVSSQEEKEDKIIITGSKGKIEFSTFNFTPIRLETGDRIKFFDIKPPINIQMPFIKSIINELTGKGKSDADLESAINTSKIMEEIVYKK
jgi:1,5-anhydro-D-fructose reductase (1,5-anhydro-D-mannitol-forming)